MSNDNLITVKAKLRLRTTEEGGRHTWVTTGYRPNHVFEYNKKGNLIGSYIGEITFDKEWLQPGDEEMVTVRFLPGESIKKYLNVGQKWWIHEGAQLVGEAEILEV
jgi:translation elongation factor EF-Tu-like GTPase